MLCVVGQHTQGRPVSPKRVDQTCRGSGSGPGRLKARCGRTSHTIDSESGPGGLKAQCGRTNHTVDSMYMARLGGWTRWTVGPLRRTSHTVDPKCMAILLCYDMTCHVYGICGWYFGGISLSFRAYNCGLMFQVLQGTMARQRCDCTAPHVSVLCFGSGNTPITNVLKTFL